MAEKSLHNTYPTQESPESHRVHRVPLRLQRQEPLQGRRNLLTQARQGGNSSNAALALLW